MRRCGRWLMVLVPMVVASIAACESSSSSSSSGGTSGSSGSLPDGGDLLDSATAPDASDSGAPVDAAVEAEAGPLDPGKCTWTATGAMSATGTCSWNVGYSAADNALDFAMTGMPDMLSFGGSIADHTTLTSGTYTLIDMPAAGGTFVIGTTSIWAMCNNNGCADGQGNNIPNQGTFTLNITAPGPVTNGILWSTPHGALDMTLPADPNTTSSGVVMVHVTF